MSKVTSFLWERHILDTVQDTVVEKVNLVDCCRKETSSKKEEENRHFQVRGQEIPLSLKEKLLSLKLKNEEIYLKWLGEEYSS